MKLAVSSLAWKPADDVAVAAAMQRHGFKGLELAPTKVWPRLDQVSEEEARRYRGFWNARGIEVVALQALLFGRDDLTLFGTQEKRDEGIEWLGARALVYGSPKFRRGVDANEPAVRQTAVAYFKRLGSLAAQHDVCLCIEPLPKDYPCDFINNLSEALALVDQVAERGFGLHVDGSSLHQGEPDARAALSSARGRIEHFHLSEPKLAPVLLSGPTPLVEYLRLLKGMAYPNWVSVEMLEHGELEQSLREVRRAWDEA
jgi:sugar phosphate isomerase/epimerase